MPILRFLLTTLAVLILIACSVIGSAKDDSPLESLLGIKFNTGTLEFHVVSTGCTSSEDFTLDVRRADGYQTLAITRIKPDVCRAMPHEKTLLIDTAALVPGVPVQLLNPFSEPPSIKRRP